MIKVTIVIPVYNLKEKIIPCLESLEKQTEKDCEFLIINDGSTDNTEDIIENYLSSKNDQRFQYLKKKNGGLADTRNYGILHASGEYVWYVDGDDRILGKNAIKEVYKKAKDNNLDVLEFNFKKLDIRDLKDKKEYIDLPREDIKGVVTGYELVNLPFDVAEWHFLWKKDFILQNDLLLDTKVWGGEDVLNTIPIVSQAKRTMYTGQCYYEYILSGSSEITGNVKKKQKYLKDAFMALDGLNDWLENQSKDVQQKSEVSNHIVKMFIGRVMEAYINDYPLSKKYINNFLKGKNLDVKDRIKKFMLTKLPKNICRKISLRLF